MRNSLIGLFCLVSVFSVGQISEVSPEVKRKLDSIYNSKIEKNDIVGASIAIVQDGKIVFANGYGFQDKENGIRANENTIYRIGSCTKSFTALSVMKLQEESKLDVNQGIQKYLESVKIADKNGKSSPILIKNILSHQSGLPGDMMNGFACYDLPNVDWMIQQLNKMSMASSPNYVHAYSNIGYSLLGKLISQVSSQEYHEYVQESIFDPLSMKSSFVVNKDNFASQVSKGYMSSEEEFQEPDIRDQSAGFIHSSVVDMANYLNMFLSRGSYEGVQIVSEASILEMEKNALEGMELYDYSEWGYGLYSKDVSLESDSDTLEYKMIGHGGDTWLFHADFQYIPELNIGAVILTNSKKGGRIASGKKVLANYLKLTEEKKLITPKGESEVYVDEQCSVEEILGEYYFQGIPMIVENPKKIKMKLNPFLKVVMKPTDEPLRYAGKVKLLGFVPIKIKNQEFRFMEKNGNIYFKVIYLRDDIELEEFVALKQNNEELSETWNHRLGKYEVVGETYTCTDCPFMDFTNLKMKLKEKNNAVFAELEGTSDDSKRELIFKEVSGSLALSVGLGRGAGETLRVLENGNLYYSGFELKKVD